MGTAGEVMPIILQAKDKKLDVSIIGPKNYGAVFINAVDAVAAESGLKIGDRLIDINGVNVMFLSHNQINASLQGQDTVTLLVQRLGMQQWEPLVQGVRDLASRNTDGTQMTFCVNVRPLAVPLEKLSGGNMGPVARVFSVTTYLNHQGNYGFKASAPTTVDFEGVYVTEVSETASVPLEIGDRIIAINGQSILMASSSDALGLLESVAPSLSIVVLRYGAEIMSRLFSAPQSVETKPPSNPPEQPKVDSRIAFTTSSRSASVKNVKFDAQIEATESATELETSYNVVSCSSSASINFELVYRAPGGLYVSSSSNPNVKVNDRLVSVNNRAFLSSNLIDYKTFVSPLTTTIVFAFLRQVNGEYRIPLEVYNNSRTLNIFTTGPLHTMVMSKDKLGKFGVALMGGDHKSFSSVFISNTASRYANSKAQDPPLYGDRLLEVTRIPFIYAENQEVTAAFRTAHDDVIAVVQRVGAAQFDDVIAKTSTSKLDSSKSVKVAGSSGPEPSRDFSMRRSILKKPTATAGQEKVRTPVTFDPRSPLATAQFSFPTVEESDSDAVNAVDDGLGEVVQVSVTRLLRNGSLGLTLVETKGVYGVFVNDNLGISPIELGDRLLMIENEFVALLEEEALVSVLKRYKTDTVNLTVLRFPSARSPSDYDPITRFKFKVTAEVRVLTIESIEGLEFDGIPGSLLIRGVPSNCVSKIDDRIMSINNTCVLKMSKQETEALLKVWAAFHSFDACYLNILL